MREIMGSLLADPADAFAIVVSRFNDLITNHLLEGTVETLQRHGASRDRLTVVKVPGSFELPLTAQKLAESRRFAAIICLGAVIQGETTHHEYINQQVAAGLMQVGLKTGIPVTFGVLTCPSLEHALNRAGGKSGNKGVEAALAALEMVHLLKQLSQS